MRSRLALLVPLAIACGSEAAQKVDTAPPTWGGEVQQLVADHCTDCHHAGGAAPFALQTWEEAAPLAEALVSAVDAGRMPPWSADPDCRSYEGERLLSAEDRDLLRAWADGGALEGEPVEAIVPRSDTLEADLVLMAEEAYTPDFSTSADDYRCQFLGHDFDTETWVTASQVVPGDAQVHHVLVFTLTGSQIDTAEALAADEQGPGYTCFSGPVPAGESAVPEGGLPGQVGAWVPGALPLVHDPGQAVRVPAGARLVMQVHYSAQGSEALASASSLRLQTTDVQPEQLIVTRPLPVYDFLIPAGDPTASATHRFTNWSDDTLRLETVAPHLHLLGTEATATVVHADDSRECLLDVPDWDFAWQQAYRLHDDDHLELAPGDAVEVTCTWDNSAANQPVVDGQQVEPQDVVWGEGTADEMCLVYLGGVEPYTPAPDASAPTCAAACGPSDSWDDLLSCPEMSATCLPCAFDALLTCTQSACGLELAAAQSCIETCGLDTLVLGGAPGDCMQATCPELTADLLSCADAVDPGESCEDAVDACDLTL